VCDTVYHLIQTLREHLPQIEKLVEEGIISIDDFDYPEFNNGCEIIP